MGRAIALKHLRRMVGIAWKSSYALARRASARASSDEVLPTLPKDAEAQIITLKKCCPPDVKRRSGKAALITLPNALPTRRAEPHIARTKASLSRPFTA